MPRPRAADPAESLANQRELWRLTAHFFRNLYEPRRC